MRQNGILMPVSALPSPYGIGCFSEEAYDFVDRLNEAGQTLWQILPLGPTSYGDSPYQSFSTFAGNPYFIDLKTLVKEGLLVKEQCESADLEGSEDRIDYGKLYATRFRVLRKAFECAAEQGIQETAEYRAFLEEEGWWLFDYALYMAVKDKFGGQSFDNWENDIRFRRPEALLKYREVLNEDVKFYEFLQYEFYRQWRRLKAYANKKGIRIIGDIPIYVAYDSADTWAEPKLFQLDEEQLPVAVAGCPPDGFSATGQLWGNPLYDWAYHKKTGYAWWIQRIRHCFGLYDIMRIDHFRGFDAYYSIPYKDADAVNGCWKKGPGMELFDAVKSELGDLPIIAEDLGFLTDSVRELLHASGYPGMKVLQFAFDSREESDYLPHNYDKNCVVYTGTHDNDTLRGWYKELTPEDQEMALTYLNNTGKDEEEIYWDCICLAMRSVADTCIIPMQDILGIGKEGRINIPSTLGGNWVWRMKRGAFTEELARKMRKLTEVYGRKPLTQKETDRNMNLRQKLEERLGETIAQADEGALYYALLGLTKEISSGKEENQGDKKVYYISAEFLIGKLLSNNLINLGIYDEVRELLEENGKSLVEIEEIEPEPSLGNGGLGRLAACFMDSIATLGLNGAGIGLNYHYGLFRQVLESYKQKEVKNPWIEKESWLTDTGIHFPVIFKNFTLTSVMYDIDIPGYESGINKLHLFDTESVDEGMVDEGITFDKEDIRRNLTLFLYPDDSDEAGQLLRIYQQYFMVSSGAQLILKEMDEKGYDIRRLYEHVVIQINDTHPSMVIPELIRLLTERGISFDEAAEIVTKTCAYTNHTILAEALEKWPLAYLEQVVPHLIPIIEKLDARVKEKYADEKVAIIDENDRVHMAHMDIHYGFSVNGVAALHTEILKNAELKSFYEIYPEKFNNKTNGITFRRWLMHCNPALSSYITKLIGEGWKKDASQLEKLLAYTEDEEALEELLCIKQKNKRELKEYLQTSQGVDISEESVFDIQIKRLHEYKRQQMNALYVIYKYKEIKAGRLPDIPVTIIFGAKAAPAYTLAKDIIHLILCLQELINQDPDVAPYLKIVMVENYNVTKAEKLIPACDISEQISLASKEASGTGNMKFMLNGAVTLGTMDGANVEIHDLVGSDNIYIFGKRSEEVIRLYETNGYQPRKYYESDPAIGELVDFIISKDMIKIGDPENLCRLYKELISKDWFMTLLDLKAYIAEKERMLEDYKDRKNWAGKMLVNIAKAGFFSSDRTIAEYNKEIWDL
ncbi:MAG: 4-alpha-glucanotransferase [Bariatricus massiliensis]|nr:4-alpha-glucanotransferase [Bariatricus massiliensis]MDY2663748.1 4-alpha-glucanotransferase [Bariatricus massiliensis]